MKKQRFFNTVLALVLLPCLQFSSACKEKPSISTPPSEPPPIDNPPSSPPDTGVTGRFDNGTMVYYEDFSTYGDTTTTNQTLQALRANGVWELDDKTTPYYTTSVPYASTSTSLYSIKNNQLVIKGYKDENGDLINGQDTYLIIQDEKFLWELNGIDYTIQYDISYDSFSNVSRFISLLWNYYGNSYNSFQLNVNGTGNLQTHTNGKWYAMDVYEPEKDLCSNALDGKVTASGYKGTSIANKLLGIDLKGNFSLEIFKNINVTVRLRIGANGDTSVYLRTNGNDCVSDDFVKVAEYNQNSPLGNQLNAHVAKCNGGSLCLKTGAAINGTVDNIMVFVGHGEEPAKKTITYVPTQMPEIDWAKFISFTQTEIVSTNEYSEYVDYNAVANPAYLIPALKEGFIPQGMDVWQEKDLLLISGYFTETTYSPSSVIISVNLKTGKFVGHYLLKNTDNTYHTGHVGGIAVTTKNLFIEHGKNLLRIPLTQIENAGDKGTLKIEDVISTPSKGGFCNYSNGMLWIGDFYRKSTHSTPTWKHLTDTETNTKYYAWAIGYKLADTESEFTSENWDSDSMEYATPDIVLAITDRIQGFTIMNDYIALSQSYGRGNDSQILIYNNPLNKPADISISLNQTNVPVWFLSTPKYSYTAMPMSEGLTSYKNQLLVLFESGSKRYSDGKNRTDRVWQLTIPDSF